jgi:hypothetical protein
LRGLLQRLQGLRNQIVDDLLQELVTGKNDRAFYPSAPSRASHHW